LPIVSHADELVVEAKVAAFTLFAVCLRTNEYMSRRVSSLVIYAWVTKKKSTKRDAWVRNDELEHPAL